MVYGLLSSCGRLKYLVPICVIGICVNYFIFDHASYKFIQAVRGFADNSIRSFNNSRASNPVPDSSPSLDFKIPKKHPELDTNLQNETKRNPEVADNSAKLPACPKEPPNLKGISGKDEKEREVVELQMLYPDIEPGGRFKPKNCSALEKLAIIFPFRNRHSHLHILLYHLLPLLMRQQLDFTLFVIEQDMPTTFNRGMLFNVGYLEALKIDKYDCFIFHDVDMIPLNDKCLYRCSDNPKHLTSAVSKWSYSLPYNKYFGGVVAFTREQFQKINGDSNLYFGWGGEDDDLRSRVAAKGYETLRYPKEIGKYDMIKHRRDAGNSPNPDRMKLVDSASKRQDLEGLNSTKYKVTGVQFKPLYTWINVYLNMTEILQTAPLSAAADIQVLLKQSKEFEKT